MTCYGAVSYGSPFQVSEYIAEPITLAGLILEVG